MDAGLSSSVEAVTIPGFERMELVHESGPRVIYRARRKTDGTEVILKTLFAAYPKTQDVAEIRREFQIADKLNIDGVTRVHSLVSYGSGNLAIEMEPFGLSLADLMAQRDGRPLSLDQCYSIAIRLAQILGQLHEQDLVHKDVKPSNILIKPESGELRLIDFGITSELSRERQSIILSKRLEGSLPYISPEQTGRMNRDLDYRSDYYSLGITLFELLIGELPFSAEHSIEWVHRHIGQPPPEAHKLIGDVPEPLSRIVSKLMAKNAEERYQSTYGLIADLERCRDEYTATGLVAAFELGQVDVSRRFFIPQKLYGRETELQQLENLFDDVAHGATELLLVSGYAGVGKTALVNELGKSIVRGRGYLVQGKFDQMHQSLAYGAFSFAFASLVQQILGEPGSRLDMWSEALREALGPNGQLVIDLVPELELIIGEQPPIPELSPTEAQNRSQIVLLNFVKVFASKEHPLVIFMDDLQWSDVPTLNLIQHLVTSRELNHLLIIGAYRSNVVDESHPLHVRMDQIHKSREFTELSLPPLDRTAVGQLIADTLYSDQKRSQPLNELLYEKAQGNPFFIKELLKRLNEDGAITFSPETGRWDWDMGVVRRAEVGENVADFMIENLRRLSKPIQRVLQLAACIGNSFDLRTLSIIHEHSMQETSAELNEALKRNMVIPLNESYKFVGLDVTSGNGSGAVNPRYKFQHDRMQQAAYALIDSDQKQAVHLSIGRLMKHHGTDQEIEERLIDIVDHLNAGRELIEDPDEYRELACLNLEAGIKAQRSSAYDSALRLLRVGHEILPGDAWQNDHDLMLALCKETQQCAYQTGDHIEADEWTAMMLEHARTPLAKAEILSARTRQYATLGRMRESIQAAIAGLSLLGVDLLETPGPAAITDEILQVDVNLRGRSIPDLIGAAELSDPEAQIAIRLLMEIFPAAFLSGSGDLFPYLVLKSVNLSLRHGNSPESAFAYAAYGMLLCGALNDPALGSEYGKLAIAMNERFDDITLKSRIIYVYTMFIHHWSNSWSSMTPWFLKGIEAGYQSGDLLYLAYSAQDCIIWDPTLDLDTASQQQRKYLAIVKDCKFQDSLDSGTLFLQMQLNFLGLTDGLYSMNDASFDETRCVEGMQQRRFMTGIANYHIYKAEIHFFYDDYEGALEHVRAQDELIASSMSLPQLVRFHILAFLTRAALYPRMEETEQEAALESLKAYLCQMTVWADNCTENFEHLRLIMEAELARLSDRMSDALRLYEQAIAAAKASEFRRDEAMANELAARYLLNLGLTKAAEGYLAAAHYLYYRWGARRKIEHLEQKYQHMLRGPVATRRTDPASQTFAETTRRIDSTRQTFTETTNTDWTSLDMSSVVKASQAISGEIDVEQLLKTTIQIVLENAGGQKGYFVVREGDQLVIHAQGETEWEGAPDATPMPVQVSDDGLLLPISVVNNVLRTGKPLVLNDATESGRFATDPYIVEQKPKSVICIPILRHGKFQAVLYMENNLTTGAFTEERVEIINLLSAQASISIENARLFEDQLRLTEAQQRFVPGQFLESLGHHDIAEVELGESVVREMSVMFADLREFTPMAERLGPHVVIELLNRYFSRLSIPITEAGGFIDSYNGDEIMALFGVSADMAVQAGIKMHRALDDFNRESIESGGPVLRMGLGVNTGSLVLGTVGANDRLKCGVVGDCVNVASRVEQLTKFYHAPFLIGEHTYERLRAPEDFSIRMVDRVVIKGKEQAIALYEVLDAESPERRAAKESTQDQLSRAMRHYFARDFVTAHAIFTAALALDPEDIVLSIFAERAERYTRKAPPSDWQGFEMLSRK